MKKNKTSFLRTAKSLFNYTRVIILALLIVVISTLTIWNASSLQAAINKRTLAYVSDVTLQLADDIDFRLSKNIVDLEMLEDSLLQINDYETVDKLKGFLDRKSQILGFTAIAILGRNGQTYFTTPLEYDIFQMPGIQASFQGKSGVSFLNQQSILYSIPIYRDTEVVGVLAGVRNKENMQKLIQSKSFSGSSLTCITDCNGKVIISPTNLDPFLQLDDIFVENSDSTVVASIWQMQQDMQQHQHGIFPFTAVDGTDLILAYHPLDSYDWVLLTLVPANLISHQTDQYIFQTFIIIAGTLLLFIVILITFLSTYRNHYKQLESYAFIDRVTGEMNNVAFQMKCEKLLRSSPPNTYSIALLNIKNFKLINENFGSAKGDDTLRHMMQILKANISESELAARADADHFFLCMRENDPEIIRGKLRKIIDDINSPNLNLAGPYHLTIQQGVYIVDDPALEVTVMQDRAKTACRNRAEYEDEQCIFYDSAFTRQLQKEHILNDLFEGSLKNRDFKVYFQPKVWVESGKIGGAEALIRWQHPQQGLIFPSDFIPLFEKNGKICSLDLYVFEEVCKTLQGWANAGMDLFPVSVNLSRQHFNKPDALLQFEQIAKRYHIPKGLIELELTESIFFDDQGIEQVKHQINLMHQMGFLCSLDDFGAGYSSLGLLMEFDIDVIKLDRRFFLDIASTKAKDVVASVIDLSKKIGANTVAEGIETAEQLDFLRSVRCDMVQGYYFSKPLPLPEFEIWKKQWETSAANGSDK